MLTCKCLATRGITKSSSWEEQESLNVNQGRSQEIRYWLIIIYYYYIVYIRFQNILLYKQKLRPSSGF